MANSKEASNEVRSWLQQGLVAAHAGDRAEARRCFQAAHGLDRDNTVALLWLAWLAPTRRESLALFCRVLEIDPNNKRAQAGRDWMRTRPWDGKERIAELLEQAEAAVAEGKSDEARQLVLEALDLDGTNVAAWSLRARLSHDPWEIRSSWEQVLALAPDHPEAQAYLSQLSSALRDSPVSPKPAISWPRQRYALARVPILIARRLAFVALALGGSSLIKYILRRLLILPVIIFVVTSVLFLVILQLPAEERVQVYVPSVNPHLTPEEYAELLETLIERYALNEPFPVQYVNWLRSLGRGEWGFSPTWRQPVMEGLRQRTPATIELMLFMAIPSIILALSLGGLAARHQGRVPDYIVRVTAFVGWAFPSFILGLVLMNLFYAWVHWFPPERLSFWANLIVKSDDFRTVTGLYTVDALLNGEWAVFVDAVRHLVLPGLTLGLVQWALLTRVMRDSMLESLGQDYITTARAKGLNERRVVNVHARRNAVLPVISIAGVATTTFISTSAVVEVIFRFNGVGYWAVKAILQSDMPVAVGFALCACLLTVSVSLLADILYAVVDPRVRLG